MRRILLAVGGVVLTGLAVLIGLAGTPRMAFAEIDGACSATLNGVNVANVRSDDRAQDIHVTQQQSIPVVFQSATGFAGHQLQIEFAGQGVPVSQKSDNGAKQFTETVSVAQYARHGVGLYKVVGVAQLTGGGTCSGAATLDVAGNPMETTAGQVAAGAAVAGTAVALFSMAAATSPARIETWQERNEREAAERYQAHESEKRMDEVRSLSFGCLGLLPVLLLMTLLMFPVMALSGGAAAGAPPPRVRGGVRITLLGLIGGVLAGLGYVVLLQQYSIVYPTLTVVLGVLIASVLVYGVVLPTIGRSIAAGRVNRRLASR